MPDDGLMTIQEVPKFLRLDSVMVAYRAIEDEGLPLAQEKGGLSSKWRISKAALLNWLRMKPRRQANGAKYRQ